MCYFLVTVFPCKKKKKGHAPNEITNLVAFALELFIWIWEKEYVKIGSFCLRASEEREDVGRVWLTSKRQIMSTFEENADWLTCENTNLMRFTERFTTKLDDIFTWLTNKLKLSQVTKPSFKLTNFMHAIHDTIQTRSIIMSLRSIIWLVFLKQGPIRTRDVARWALLAVAILAVPDLTTGSGATDQQTSPKMTCKPHQGLICHTDQILPSLLCGRLVSYPTSLAHYGRQEWRETQNYLRWQN